MLGRRMQRCWPPDRKIKSYSIITFQNIYTNKRGLWYFHDTFWKKKKIFFLPLLGLILTYWISVSLTYPRYHCVWLKICKKKHSACAYVLSALSERESKSSTNIHSDPTQYRAGIKEKPLAGAAQKKEKRGKEMRKVTSIHETDF